MQISVINSKEEVVFSTTINYQNLDDYMFAGDFIRQIIRHTGPEECGYIKLRIQAGKMFFDHDMSRAYFKDIHVMRDTLRSLRNLLVSMLINKEWEDAE